MVWSFPSDKGGWDELTVGDPQIPSASDEAKIAFPPDPPNDAGQSDTPKVGLFLPNPPA